MTGLNHGSAGPNLEQGRSNPKRCAAAGEASEVAGVGIFVRRSRTEGSYG